MYIDVDGVLLGKSKCDDPEIVLANYAVEFLEYCLERYSCCWLTTHCKEGDIAPVVDYLGPYVDNYGLELLKSINPVKWDVLKTEAIDLKSNFYWIDDQLLQSEIDVLENSNVLNRWIQVNTREHLDGLHWVLSILKMGA